MPIVRVYPGDLLKAKVQTVVNPVNCVGAMGAGLAAVFKARAPDMYQVYRSHCHAGNLTVGKLMLWKRSSPWILNFPTKNDWKDPARLEYIEQGLIKFVETCDLKGITHIAFPQLGCGHGDLPWEQVYPLMQHYLDQVRARVEIVLHR